LTCAGGAGKLTAHFLEGLTMKRALTVCLFLLVATAFAGEGPEGEQAQPLRVTLVDQRFMRWEMVVPALVSGLIVAVAGMGVALYSHHLSVQRAKQEAKGQREQDSRRVRVMLAWELLCNYEGMVIGDIRVNDSTLRKFAREAHRILSDQVHAASVHELAALPTLEVVSIARAYVSVKMVRVLANRINEELTPAPSMMEEFRKRCAMARRRIDKALQSLPVTEEIREGARAIIEEERLEGE